MIDLNVEGMHCEACARRVTKIVQGEEPTAQVTIDLAQGRVSIQSARNAASLAAAITEGGYPAKPVA